MGKPHWNDAPIWAQWLAQDLNGAWTWWEYEPEPAFFDGLWYRAGDSNYEWAAADTGNEDWKTTLEARPC